MASDCRQQAWWTEDTTKRQEEQVSTTPAATGVTDTTARLHGSRAGGPLRLAAFPLKALSTACLWIGKRTQSSYNRTYNKARWHLAMRPLGIDLSWIKPRECGPCERICLCRILRCLHCLPVRPLVRKWPTGARHSALASASQ